MKGLQRIFYALLLAIIIPLHSCSTESSATVVIHTGLEGDYAVQENSIIEKLFRIFVKSAYAQSAPTNLVSLKLIISGDELAPVEYSYSPPYPATITVVIPAGNHDFEIFADTPLVTVRGFSNEDIKAGVVNTVNLKTKFYEAKIIMPDRQNNRLIAIDDMTGSNWQTYTTGMTNVNDVAFDGAGRIYVAVNLGAGPSPLYRLNDFSDITPQTLLTVTGLTTVAVDNTRDILYHTTGNAMARSNLDGSSPTTLSEPFNSIRGLAVDEETGYLIVANGDRVSVYDPVGESELDFVTIVSTIFTGYEEVWDVKIIDGKILATLFDDNNSTKVGKIIEFSFNSSTNTLSQTNEYSTNLLGVHRIFPHKDNKIVFNDEQLTQDRLISIDNILGSNRQVYGQSGNAAAGPGFFDFYE